MRRINFRTVLVGGTFGFSITSSRVVQFRQTTDTTSALHDSDPHRAAKWVVKSTKDMMSEANRDAFEQLEKDEKYKFALSKRFEDQSTQQLVEDINRISHFKESRVKKNFNIMKRLGIIFVIMYGAVYVGCLVGIYFVLAKKLIRKETLFEIASGWFGMDQELFLARVEEWDSMINFGFAFCLNEALEPFRLLILLPTFLYCKNATNVLTRRFGKRSFFRRSAGEV